MSKRGHGELYKYRSRRLVGIPVSHKGYNITVSRYLMYDLFLYDEIINHDRHCRVIIVNLTIIATYLSCYKN